MERRKFRKFSKRKSKGKRGRIHSPIPRMDKGRRMPNSTKFGHISTIMQMGEEIDALAQALFEGETGNSSLSNKTCGP
jgi:hypothetical protein